MAQQYPHAGSADTARRQNKFLLLHRQNLTTHNPRHLQPVADTERDEYINKPRLEYHHQ